MKRVLSVVCLLLGQVLSASEAAYEPDEHTVLLLHFDEGSGETAADASASGLQAELLPNPRRPLWVADGKFGGCLRFDGVNDDRDGDGRGDADALWFRDGAKLHARSGLTVEAWIKPAVTDRNQGLISRSGGGRYCFFVYGTSLYLSLQMESTGPPSWARVLAPNAVSAGVWQHVAATYDGERLCMYRDGHLVAEEACTGEPLGGEAVTMIGCDTDSRPLPSAIRGYQGLIDEVRVSNIARTSFNVSPDRRDAAASRSVQPVVAGPPEHPKYADPPVPPLNRRRVKVTGRVVDGEGSPVSGVMASDGEQVTVSDPGGGFELAFEVDDLRFVWVTAPSGYRVAGPWYVRVTRDGEDTAVDHTFTLEPDVGSARASFSFLTTGDTQFSDLTTYAELLAEYDQVTRMSGDPGFFAVAGDLTMSGTQWEMDLYKDVCAKARIPLHNCFGGHDGNYSRAAQGRGSTYNYRRNLGPAWYSWDYGPVHFVTYVSEASFLTENEQVRQGRWLERDLAAQPEGRPVVLVTHQPPSRAALEGWLNQANIIGAVYGHWHVPNVCGTERVPYIDTGPMRGRDWGAFSRVFRIVSFADGRLSSEMRVCGQVQRVEIVAPQAEVRRGVVPVQVKAYDTAHRVRAVECRISGDGGETLVELAASGAWTWSGNWDARALSPGVFNVSVSILDERGRTWRETARVTLAEAPGTAVRLGEDWPGFFRQGHSRVRGERLAPPLRLAWVANTGGRHQHAVTPVVYGGRAYVGVDCKEIGHPGVGVACYDPPDGRRVWHAETDSSVCFAPAAADGAVFAVSSLGSCYCLDAATGARRWRTEPFGSPSGHRLVRCCPVLVEGEVLLTGSSGVYPVLDSAAGETLRELRLGGGLPYFSFPSVDGGRVFGGQRKAAVACDWNTGKALWSTPIATGKIASTPVPYQGRLYVNASRLSCLDAVSGAKLWEQSVPTSGNGISVAVPVGDMVLANGASLKAFETATGKLRWEHSYGYDAETAKHNQRQALAGQSTPAVAGDVVYVGGDDGYLYAFALADGEVLWRYNVGVPIKGSPIVSGNALFVCDWDGNLFCFTGK